MIKKIGLSLLSLFVILGFGVSLANPIAPETHYICSMFENVEIDNYRVVVQNGSEFYEPKVKQCSECGNRSTTDGGFGITYIINFSYNGPTQDVFLLDKTIDTKDVTVDNIGSNAILIGSITSTYCDISYKDETKLYKVVKSGNGYTMLDRTEHYKTIQEIKDNAKQFPIFWLLAVIIETGLLFFIAKLFWEGKENVEEIGGNKDEVSNKRLLLFGIIPTTVTLPLLWFVLPLIIWNGILYIVVGEILVIILEAIILKYGLNISWKKSIIASIICNVFSFVILGWGSLIMDFYNSKRIIWETPIWVKIYLPMLYFLTEFSILCVMGKIWGNNSEISKKKLILTGIVAPIISILLLILLAWGIIALDAGIGLENRGTLVAILISLFVEILLIKKLLKISWKKSIIMVILSILCFIVLCFIVRSILFGL